MLKSLPWGLFAPGSSAIPHNHHPEILSGFINIVPPPKIRLINRPQTGDHQQGYPGPGIRIEKLATTRKPVKGTTGFEHGGRTE